MNIRLAFILCAICYLSSCSTSNNYGLEGTTWLNPNFDNCISRISFQDSCSFHHYYCGVNETNYGYYSVKDDTIVLEEYVIFDVPISLQIRDSSLRFKYHCIIVGDTLKLVKYFDLEYNYVEDIKREEFFYVKQKEANSS